MNRITKVLTLFLFFGLITAFVIYRSLLTDGQQNRYLEKSILDRINALSRFSPDAAEHDNMPSNKSMTPAAGNSIVSNTVMTSDRTFPPVDRQPVISSSKSLILTVPPLRSYQQTKENTGPVISPSSGKRK